jgi:hypothetical protein
VSASSFLPAASGTFPILYVHSPACTFCANLSLDPSIHSGPSFSPCSTSSNRRQEAVRAASLCNFKFEYHPMRALRCYTTLGIVCTLLNPSLAASALTSPYFACSFASGHLPRVHLLDQNNHWCGASILEYFASFVASS